MTDPHPAADHPTPAVVVRPHTSVPAIVIGLICLLAGGSLLAGELSGSTLDVTRIGPAGLVGIGTVLLLAGAVTAVLNRRRAAGRD